MAVFNTKGCNVTQILKNYVIMGWNNASDQFSANLQIVHVCISLTICIFCVFYLYVPPVPKYLV